KNAAIAPDDTCSVAPVLVRNGEANGPRATSELIAVVPDGRLIAPLAGAKLLFCPAPRVVPVAWKKTVESVATSTRTPLASAVTSPSGEAALPPITLPTANGTIPVCVPVPLAPTIWAAESPDAKAKFTRLGPGAPPPIGCPPNVRKNSVPLSCRVRAPRFRTVVVPPAELGMPVNVASPLTVTGPVL